MSRLSPPALLSLACLAMLAACDRQSELPQGTVQRVELAETGQRPAMADPSPDTSAAGWRVAEDGQAIHFGNMGEPPLLTLACDLAADPTEFVIIRHARAYPGQSALFPVLGNGISSRFLVDAKLADGEWNWEARLPPEDPQLEVFLGTRDITATLPGRGMLEIGGGRITGEFLEWCRAGGSPAPVESDSPQKAAEPEG